MTFLDERYAGVVFRPEIPCVHITWYGYANTKQSQKALNAVIDAMLETKLGSVIADVTEMKVINPEMQAWNHDIWMPRAVKAGYSVLALVQSNDFFNQVAVNNIITAYKKDYGDDFKINVVKSQKEAEEWISTLES